MSLSLVISPVEDCPDGVGLSDVQCSPMGGFDGAGGLLATGASCWVSWTSLSGALVATSGSAMVILVGWVEKQKVRVCIQWTRNRFKTEESSRNMSSVRLQWEW